MRTPPERPSLRQDNIISHIYQQMRNNKFKNHIQDTNNCYIFRRHASSSGNYKYKSVQAQTRTIITVHFSTLNILYSTLGTPILMCFVSLKGTSFMSEPIFKALVSTGGFEMSEALDIVIDK